MNNLIQKAEDATIYNSKFLTHLIDTIVTTIVIITSVKIGIIIYRLFSTT
jgi:hypothetical protein